MVVFVLGLKGEGFSGRDEFFWKRESYVLSEVMGMCGWVRGVRIVLGKGEYGGFGRSGFAGGIVLVLWVFVIR